MSQLLHRLLDAYGDVPETLRVTDGGIWHATPLHVLASAMAVIEREKLLLKRDSVLDAGAGDGRVLAAMALAFESLELDLLGIECDALLVEEAHRRLAHLPRPPAVTRGDYLADVQTWPSLTLHYPDGNEHALLRRIDEQGSGSRLLVLSPEIAPNLGRAAQHRWEVRSDAHPVGWSLSLYGR